MSDLISRQAAIDLFLAEGMVTAAVYVERMPSAQQEIIRCKDCKHGRPYKHTREYVACEVDVEPIDRDKDFFCAYGERRETNE